MNMSMAYLDWVRKRFCIICGDRAEPHHMIAVGMGGNRKKPSIIHFMALAMCRIHHSEFHAKGLQWVNDTHMIDLWKETAKQEAEYLWELTNMEVENDRNRINGERAEICGRRRLPPLHRGNKKDEG